MRQILLTLVVLISFSGFAQKDFLKFRIEKSGKQQELWVTNTSPSVLTVEVEFTVLDNCYHEGLDEIYIIESQSDVKIANLAQSDPSLAWKWNYRYWWRLGSAHALHSNSIVYQLPYYRGSTFKVIQGNNGTFSHYGEIAYAVDFAMPENTPVTATRSGRVVMTESTFKDGGVDEYYRNRVNFVRILHSDGTVGNYYHFKHGGVNVSVGQEVRAGQLIGYSGNTGFSSTPHLHFDVSRPINGKESETLAVYFRTSNSKSEELVQGTSYTAP